MRIVLDTNVFISGIFFIGPPYQILKAWRDGRVQILVSPGHGTFYGVDLSHEKEDLGRKRPGQEGRSFA